MSEATWTTRDGRVLLITKMETTHLRNTIAFLRRRAMWFLKSQQHGWDHFDESEVDPTPDDADEVLLSEVPAFPAMIVEFNRRLHPCGDEHWSG